jgi:hypothetical protein
MSETHEPEPVSEPPEDEDEPANEEEDKEPA